ncbi:MAG: penicillin-binding protein activator LpoB [Planctomycetes bacterium]|nr:penicillin-binding protein activator LpoB [Planctomycetota bacterium]MCK5473520.1 penicillin-binding protein activator LpoB [Planctomycetota bacterium]
MKTKILVMIAVSGILFAGCAAQTSYIDTMHDDGKVVMGLDYRDFDQAASEMVQSMLGSGALRKQDGSRYVMATSRIINDTMQRIDTDQLMAKIEEELLNSGQVVMTSAAGSKTDQMIYDMRDERDTELGEEFDSGTIASKGQLIAPELSISGKIFQRNIRYDKKRQQVEYYFQLKITNLTSGLRFWQKETLIGKRGSNKSVAW